MVALFFQVPLFMTQGYIMNVIQKLGHYPVRATISKDKRASDKAVCTIQFSNVDAAREAVSQLNGKSVSISGSGSVSWCWSASFIVPGLLFPYLFFFFRLPRRSNCVKEQKIILSCLMCLLVNWHQKSMIFACSNFLAIVSKVCVMLKVLVRELKTLHILVQIKMPLLIE